MKPLKLFSPAKINGDFRILGKRADGYHEITSHIQAIDLGDTLLFSLASTDQLTCSDPLIPTDEKNLVSKALSLFRKETGFSSPVAIHIEKQIPIEAGLGGGSSNAATALWGLSQLFGCPVPEHLASQIGADCPFFFSSGSADCSGFGEIVRSVEPKIPFHSFWIVKPTEGLSTKAIFSQVVIDQKTSPSLFINDLEPYAFSLLPRLQQIKQRLIESGFEAVWMTGSGSALICCGEQIPPSIENTRVFRAKRVSRKKDAWYYPGNAYENLR